MPIPNFQTLMLPLLELASDRLEHSFKDAIPFLAEKFDLTENEKQELLPSSKQSKFNKRVYLAKTHLFKAGLLDSDRRNAFRTTEEGIKVLATNPLPIDTKFLERYDSYCEFRTPAKQKKYVLSQTTPVNSLAIAQKTREKLDNAYQQFQTALFLEVLKTIEQCSFCCFKSLVIDTLFSMGYGSSPKEIDRALKRSPNHTLDGIIEAKRLGWDTIYIEAKHQQNKVTKSEIQEFLRTLIDRGVSQGIFITISDFSPSAIDYTNRIESQIMLINGQKLAELAIAHNIGVTPLVKYEVKQIEIDYFLKD